MHLYIKHMSFLTGECANTNLLILLLFLTQLETEERMKLLTAFSLFDICRHSLPTASILSYKHKKQLFFFVLKIFFLFEFVFVCMDFL